MLIHFGETESWEGEQREGGTESEAGSRLWAVSTEPDAGLKLMNHEIITWAEVGCSTDWATQAPHSSCALFILFTLFCFTHPPTHLPSATSSLFSVFNTKSFLKAHSFKLIFSSLTAIKWGLSYITFITQKFPIRLCHFYVIWLPSLSKYYRYIYGIIEVIR